MCIFSFSVTYSDIKFLFCFYVVHQLSDFSIGIKLDCTLSLGGGGGGDVGS